MTPSPDARDPRALAPHTLMWTARLSVLVGTASILYILYETTLLAAYDGERPPELPARFVYSRRLVAVLCGAMVLQLARDSGSVGATGGEVFNATPSLSDFYQRMRAGSVSPATGEGQWWFGLALMRESSAL